MLSTELYQSANIVSENFDELTYLIKNCIDSTCKLQKPKFTKRNTMQNPWIIQGIIKSIKHRDNLYYRWNKTISRVNKAGDPRKHEEYRTFRNKLGNIIKAQKQLHYTKKFERNVSNKRATYKLINNLRGKSAVPLLQIFY